MDQVSNDWLSTEEVENSADYQALLIAAAGKPARSMGKSVIPAEPPRWQDVLKHAKQLQIRQPAHAGVLVNIVKAESNLHGVVGLKSSLERLLAAFTSNWENIYPVADPDDPDDPFYGRINFLRELSDQPQFLDNLYRCPLVNVRAIGAFSARDMDISAGILDASEEDKARCQAGFIRGAFEESDTEELRETADSFAAASKAVASLELLFSEQSGGTNGLSMLGLEKRISECQAKFLEFAGDRIATKVEVKAEEATSDAVILAPSGGPSSLTSTMSNRYEATNALNQVVAYYQALEPSSPVLIFAHRTREMINKPFFEILQELAPANQTGFGDIMNALARDPLAHLIEDSYQRFLGGERVPGIEPEQKTPSSIQSTASLSPQGTDQQVEENVLDDAESSRTNYSGSIVSRTAVLEVLADIELYFRDAEPSSPVPLVLNEMRKLVPKTFTDLIAEFSKNPGNAAVSGKPAEATNE